MAAPGASGGCEQRPLPHGSPSLAVGRESPCSIPPTGDEPRSPSPKGADRVIGVILPTHPSGPSPPTQAEFSSLNHVWHHSGGLAGAGFAPGLFLTAEAVPAPWEGKGFPCLIAISSCLLCCWWWWLSIPSSLLWLTVLQPGRPPGWPGCPPRASQGVLLDSSDSLCLLKITCTYPSVP